MKIAFFIAHASAISVLIPLGLAIAHWKKIPTEISTLKWVLIASFIIDVTSFFFMKFSMNTHPLGNAYLFIQFSILFYIFSFYNSRKILLKFLYAFFVVFYAINLFFIQSPQIFNTNSNVISSLILIGLSISFFYRLLNELSIFHVHRLPMLWLSFATLIYYSGTLFLFLISNYLFQSTDESNIMMWILHNLLNITKNILFAIALWQSYRTVRSSI